MVRIVILLIALCLLCSCATKSEAGAMLPDEIEIYFFHDTACGSCDGAEEFYDILYEELGESRSSFPYKVLSYNVFQTDGYTKYEQVLQEYGLSQDQREFPVMIVYSKVFSGMESIKKNIKEAFLTAGEDIFEKKSLYLPSLDSQQSLFTEVEMSPEKLTVLYFYRITCDECNRTESVIRAIPESIEVEGKPISIEVVALNTRSGRNGDRVRFLFDAYDVLPDDQMVPIVFVGERYLAGYDAIAANLRPLLEQSVGVRLLLAEEEQ